jgi:hypothetical protein
VTLAINRNMKQILSIALLSGFVGLAACSGNQQKDAALQAQQRTIDSMNTELAKKRVIDSMNEITKTQYVFPQNGVVPAATAVVAPAATSSVARTTRRSHAAHTTRRSSSSTSQTSSSTQPVVYQEPAPAKKRGWSAKAKGAVIGTAAGAAAGAIINKRNRGAGAVIGGVLGAGAGTGVGAIIDKKKGR